MPSIKELRQVCQKSVPELDKYPLLFKAIRVLSIYLTWILIKTPLTPNSITVLGIFSAVLGLFSFMVGWHILGIVFFIFCIISDFSDGEVSRYKNLKSKEGTYLDKVHHLYSNAIFFIALTLLFFNATSDIAFFYAGLIIIPFSILLPFTVTYGIDVAVLTHMRYYAENSKRFILTGIENQKKNTVDAHPSNKRIKKTLKDMLRELVNLSRYWGFPPVYCVFGLIAMIEVMFLNNTHTLTRLVFIFYALSYPLWTLAFLSRVLSNRIIEREVGLLVETLRLRSNE